MTMKDLEKLQKLGKIRGFQQQELKPVKVTVGGRVVVKHFHKPKSQEKDWISMNLLYWCNERCLQLEEEYRFHPERKFRFDWYIPALKIGIEYNGLFSAKSRHTTPSGYTGDMDKLNSAQALGYRVIQVTPMNYKNLFRTLETYL